MSHIPPSPLWHTLRADMTRLQEEGGGLRALLRGLLSQGFHAVLVYRIFRWCYERHIPTQPIRLLVERFIEITTGISIPVEASIGRGLRIHHFGGIILHPRAVVGEGCTIYQGVTLGDLGGWGGAPRLGKRVTVGAGAKILGEVEIGDDTFVGANSVVLRSVPPNSLAVGVPAVVKPRGLGRHRSVVV